MGVNLQLLGMQSIPRLAKKLGASVDFPERVFSTPMGVKDFQSLFERSGEILAAFFKDFGVSWWDVYGNSDIGLERSAIAQEMKLREHDRVLDVGCGRGYFTIAAAKLSQLTVGVDLMNGLGRHHWWKNFRESLREMSLADKVQGVKADAKCLPFETCSFSVAATVHAVRNLQDYSSIETVIGEMKRVVKKGGRVIVVESLPIARSKAQEAHLQMFRCKARYTLGDIDFPPKHWTKEVLLRTGFTEIKVKELDYNRSAVPPIFCIDHVLPSLPEDKREEAKEEYNRAMNMIWKWGEVSPPALLAEATK